jgi:hypothetical protein
MSFDAGMRGGAGSPDRYANSVWRRVADEYNRLHPGESITPRKAKMVYLGAIKKIRKVMEVNR